MWNRIPLILVTAYRALGQELPAPPTWTATAPLFEARHDSCAVTLRSGRILVTGGSGSGGPLASTELFEPEGSFRAGAPMKYARAAHSCTLLADGRVLVAGGGEGSDAELYSPDDDAWQIVAGSGQIRSGHAAILLGDGRVLLAGGSSPNGPIPSVEIYEPQEQRITALETSLTEARESFRAAHRADGKVALIGGRNANGALKSTDVFDPASNTIEAGPELRSARAGHSATALGDGRIFVAGGTDGERDLDSAEVFDLEQNAFLSIASKLHVARRDHAAILIPGNGSVLLAGGLQGEDRLGDTELFQPIEDVFFRIGNLTLARSGIALAIIRDGEILAAGGQTQTGPQSACGIMVVPSVRFSKTLYAPNETIMASGSSFPANTDLTFALDFTSGVQTVIANNRLLTGSLRTSGDRFSVVGGFGPANIVRLSDSDPGRVFRLSVRQPDGTTTRTTAPVKITTRMALALPTDPVYEGSNVDFRATVLRDVATRAMTGPFTISAFSQRVLCPPDRSPLATNTLSLNSQLLNETVSTTLAGAPPGQLCIFSKYAGDGANAESSTFGSYRVASKTPGIILSASNTRPQAGQPVTVTARVEVERGLPARSPSGAVAFQLDGFPFSIGTNSATSATVMTSTVPFTPLIAGIRSFGAQFSNDPFYFAANSTSPVTLDVQRANTTLSAVNPTAAIACGEPINIPVELTYPGVLGLSNRSVQASATTLASGGSVLLPTLILTPMPNNPGRATTNLSVSGASFLLTSMQFSFSGDATLAPSSTPVTPIAIRRVNPTVDLRVNINRSTGRFEGGISAIVSGNPCQIKPTGTVQILDGADPVVTIGLTAFDDIGGTSAASTTLSRPSGVRNLSVRYSGDLVYSPASSPVVGVTFP